MRQAGLVAPASAAAPRAAAGAPAPGTQLEEHYANCFACGSDAPGGLRLRAFRAEGCAVRAVFRSGPGHQGAPGLIHGGVLAAVFDEVLGFVVDIVNAGPAVTRRLETDFLAPVPVGADLHVHGWATGVEGRKLWAEGEARLGTPDGPLAARGAGLFIRVAAEHFEPYADPAGARPWEHRVNP